MQKKGFKMKKNYIQSSLGAVIFLCAGIVIGYSLNNYCKKDMAVVDINQIVSKSAQVQSFKDDFAAKNSELNQWLKTSQEKVDAEENKEKKKELLQNYSAEYAQKRNELSKEYMAKVQEIDKDVSNTIIQAAKEKGYKSVVAKNVVIYGGDDITDEVIKIVK